MPSCVVKGCKNSSSFQNKAAGFTFHKFPVSIMWKENWIRAVRDLRNDADWLPSKFSVVCSLHFHDDEMYHTKAGYRRIKKTAIPKQVYLIVLYYIMVLTLVTVIVIKCAPVFITFLFLFTCINT